MTACMTSGGEYNLIDPKLNSGSWMISGFACPGKGVPGDSSMPDREDEINMIATTDSERRSRAVCLVLVDTGIIRSWNSRNLPYCCGFWSRHVFLGAPGAQSPGTTGMADQEKRIFCEL